VPTAAWIVAIWMVLRLLWLTREQIAAYRYLAGGMACVLGVQATLAGATLRGGTLPRAGTFGFVLWGFCLWGAASLHSSLKKPFEPAQPRTTRFAPAQMVLCVIAITVAPLGLLCVSGARDAADSLDLTLMAVIAPALLAVYLVRQVFDRARAE